MSVKDNGSRGQYYPGNGIKPQSSKYNLVLYRDKDNPSILVDKDSGDIDFRGKDGSVILGLDGQKKTIKVNGQDLINQINNFKEELKNKNQLITKLESDINKQKEQFKSIQKALTDLTTKVDENDATMWSVAREVTSNDEVLWKSLTGVRDELRKSLTGVRDELRKSLTEAREVLRKKIDAQHLDLSGVELKVIKTNHGDNMQWFWAFNGQPAYGVKQSEWER